MNHAQQHKIGSRCKIELDLEKLWHILELSFDAAHEKALPFQALLVMTASMVQAAPVLQPKDFSEETLTGIATDRQKASIERYNKAKARAEKEREAVMQEAA